MKFNVCLIICMLALFAIIESARIVEDSFAESGQLDEFEDGMGQRNYISKDDSEVSNSNTVVFKRMRRGICNSACSCGWGNCVYSPGYRRSLCCTVNYAWHCC